MSEQEADQAVAELRKIAFPVPTTILKYCGAGGVCWSVSAHAYPHYYLACHSLVGVEVVCNAFRLSAYVP